MRECVSVTLTAQFIPDLDSFTEIRAACFECRENFLVRERWVFQFQCTILACTFNHFRKVIKHLGLCSHPVFVVFDFFNLLLVEVVQFEVFGLLLLCVAFCPCVQEAHVFGVCVIPVAVVGCTRSAVPTATEDDLGLVTLNVNSFGLCFRFKIGGAEVDSLIQVVLTFDVNGLAVHFFRNTTNAVSS
ncbi:hypothetical protein D3C85_1251000 [compost metagenome]